MKRSAPAALLRKLSLVSSIAAAILQLLALLLSFERGTNYFEMDAALPGWASACTLLAILLGAVGARLTPPEPLRAATPFSSKTLADLPVALGAFLCGATLLTGGYGTLGSCSGLLLLVMAAYLCLPKGASAEQNPLLTQALGFFAVIACGILCAYYYFDTTVEMNSPIKISLQLALLSAMLYYTGELRYLLGRPLPRLYLALSAILPATAALPALFLPVGRLIGLINRNDYTAGAVLVLLLAVSAVMRSHHLLASPAESPIAPDPTNPEQSDEKGDDPA